MTDHHETHISKSDLCKEWETAFDAIQDWVMLLDLERRVVRSNHVGEKLAGVPQARMCQYHCCELIHGAKEALPGCPFLSMLQSRKRETAELQIPDKSRWLKVIVDPVNDERGNLVGAVHIACDITERKRAEEQLASEHNLLRTLIDNLPDWAFVKDVEGRFVLANTAVAGHLKLSCPEELVGKTDFDFAPRALAEEYQAEEQDIVRTGWPMINREHRFTDRAGNTRWFISSKAAWRDQEGTIVGIVGLNRDITERKKAEKKLQTRAAMLDAVGQVLRETLLCESEEELGKTCLSVAEALTGSKFGYMCKLNTKGFFDVIAISDPGWHTCEIPEDKATPRLYNMEVQGIRGRVMAEGISMIFNEPASHPDWIEPPDGHPPITSFLGVPLKHSGKVFGMIGLGNKQGGYTEADREAIETLSPVIVEALMRKRAEESLRDSEAHLHLALRAAEMGTWRWDARTGRYTRSASFNRILGHEFAKTTLSVDDFIGQVHPEDRASVKSAIQSAIRRHESYVAEFRIVRPDGEVRWLRDQGTMFYGQQDGMTCMTGAVVDITERRQAEQELRKERDFSNTLIQASPALFLAIDADNRIMRMNEVLLNTLGCRPDEAIGTDYVSTFVPEAHREAEAVALEDLKKFGVPVQYESGLLAKDGQELLVEWHARPIQKEAGKLDYIIALGIDITERRQAEQRDRELQEQHAHAWRVNTMGEMASGLAHEINQPLCAISSSVEACLNLTRESALELPELLSGLELIGGQARLAGEIVERIRDFTRKHETRESTLDINEAVREAASLVEAEVMRHNARLCLELADKQLLVRSDPIEIEQVVLNLVRNGLEAMADIEANRRTLTVRTSVVDNNNVEVAVCDMGCGLSAEVNRQLFDPFFTTKLNGMGLGLSISRSIIETHEGRIWATPNSERGTTLHFILPIENATSKGTA